MNVEFSVVVPLYNKEREVGAALDSVLGQRRLPREIIVVDDGSTDGGAAVVGGYTSPLIRLVTQKNAGVSAARNRGAVLARSEYIAFLDADDRWQPGYLEKMAFLIEQYPDCGAYAAAFDIVSGDRIYSNVHPAQEGIVPDFFREAMRSYICQPSATVVPRGVFQELGGVSGRDEDRGRPLFLDTAGKPLPDLFHAGKPRPLQSDGFEPLGRNLYTRTDGLFV